MTYPQIEDSPVIDGVQTVKLRSFADDRGSFLEIFRQEWFPQRNWHVVQSNCSRSSAGILRGLHYHHQQVDYWYVLQGSIRTGLVDLRPSTNSYGATIILDLHADDNIGLYIPTGVAHGFFALTRATLLYFVDNYYDGNDEFGVAWDDPDIGIPWGVVEPVISRRDIENPQLSDIPEQNLPA
jgi:dTDP-4-dehydrorhamnose 3,5-epimerase